MLFWKLWIEQISPHWHVDPIPTLCMEMHDGARSDKRIQLSPYCRRLIGEVMEPYRILRVEHCIGGIDRRLDGIGRTGQLRTLLHQPFENLTALSIFPRIGQTWVRGADQLK